MVSDRLPVNVPLVSDRLPVNVPMVSDRLPVNIPMVVMKGSNCSLLLRGSTEQLMGAMAAGRASHTLCSSPSRTPKLCSKMAYMIRPIPKEGSITEGTMSTTVCVCKFV